MSAQYLHIVSIIMVMLGLCFMIVSVRVSLAVNKVVRASLRRKWYVITSLMVLFLIGYSAFLIIQFQNSEKYLEAITGIVFLGGALFVLLVMGLIQNTLAAMNKASRSLEEKIKEHEWTSEELKESRAGLESIFNSAIPLCITNKNFEIVHANDEYYDMFGRPASQGFRQKCFESRPSDDCRSDNCPMIRIAHGEKEVISDMSKQVEGQEKTFIVTARPFLNAQKETIGIVESFQDITTRKLAEDAKEELIEGLQHALDEVNLLSGLLPICASCKKIRDDKGYWNKIESYITNHSKVEFSHSICPDCAQKLYPDLYQDVTENKN
jgi:PAS domain S-box-containing protein